MQQKRIHSLDIMRGVAVIVMVLGHSIDAVLSTETRASEAFRLYDAVRGFTAPVFLFVSGFAFSVVTERRWEEYRRWSGAVRHRLLKVLLLLAVGYALHLPFLSLTKLLTGTTRAEYAQFLQADVLHCVAASILLLQAMVLVSPSPRVFSALAFGASLAIVFATPVVWSIDAAPILSMVIAPYLNQHQTSIFPLFPFAGFMMAGTVTAHFYLRAQRAGTERLFFRSVALSALAAALYGLVADLLPFTLYAPHDYWKTSPNFFMIRLGAVLMVTVGFFSLKGIPAWLEKQILTLGRASLLVYACHLVLVYGSVANPGLAQIVGRILPFPLACAVGLTVLGAMILLVRLWNYISTHHFWPTRFAQASVAGTITYLFFTNPW